MANYTALRTVDISNVLSITQHHGSTHPSRAESISQCVSRQPGGDPPKLKEKLGECQEAGRLKIAIHLYSMREAHRGVVKTTFLDHVSARRFVLRLTAFLRLP